MWQAVGLLALGNQARIATLKVLILLVAGTCLFSGSLYLLALTGIHWLGLITPLGGLCMLAGWGLVALAHFQGAD